jgi:hypothetical protein
MNNKQINCFYLCVLCYSLAAGAGFAVKRIRLNDNQNLFNIADLVVGELF